MKRDGPRQRLAVPPGLFLGLIVGLVAGASGCGYRFAGRANLLPTSWHVIAVTSFRNDTRVPELSQLMTAAVTREMIARTRYHVQPELSGADAVLRGVVTSIRMTPVTYNAASTALNQPIQATTVAVRLELAVTLRDRRTRRIVFQNGHMVFREQYQVGSLTRNFFEEDQAAEQRLSRQVAQTLVADILENF